MFITESMDDFQNRDGVIEIRYKWKGFEEKESNWVSDRLLREDVPGRLSEFLRTRKMMGPRASAASFAFSVLKICSNSLARGSVACFRTKAMNSEK